MSVVENSLQSGAPSPQTRFVEVNRLLRDLTAQLEADPQVTAAYLARWGDDEGLGAQNDAWASLNLHVVIKDEYLPHFATGKRAYAARVREPLLWVEAPQNAPEGGYYLMAWYDGTAGAYEVDWYFRPSSRSPAVPEQTVILVNKQYRGDAPPLAGGFNGTTPTYNPNVPPALQIVLDAQTEQERAREAGRNRIHFFWAMWLITARYVARNPHEERMNFLPLLRDLLCDTRAALGDATPFEAVNPPQQTPGEKIAVLQDLAREMEALHPRAAEQGISLPAAIVPRARAFLNLVADTVGVKPD